MSELEALEQLVDDEGQVVALFTAPTWCVPCRRFEPHWEKAKDKLVGVTMVKYDLGERPEDTGSHWASQRFSILGVPTVKFFARGEEPLDVKARTLLPFVAEVNDLLASHL